MYYAIYTQFTLIFMFVAIFILDILKINQSMDMSFKLAFYEYI